MASSFRLFAGLLIFCEISSNATSISSSSSMESVNDNGFSSCSFDLDDGATNLDDGQMDVTLRQLAHFITSNVRSDVQQEWVGNDRFDSYTSDLEEESDYDEEGAPADTQLSGLQHYQQNVSASFRRPNTSTTPRPLLGRIEWMDDESSEDLDHQIAESVVAAVLSHIVIMQRLAAHPPASDLKIRLMNQLGHNETDATEIELENDTICIICQELLVHSDLVRRVCDQSHFMHQGCLICPESDSFDFGKCPICRRQSDDGILTKIKIN